MAVEALRVVAALAVAALRVVALAVVVLPPRGAPRPFDAVGAGAAGNRTEIVVPSPIRDVAVIEPPWATTISRDTNSPSPRPVARCGWRSRV